MNYPGYWITFEGGEGSGKSTQIKYASDLLQSMGLDVLFLREPGGTEVGDSIRGTLFDRFESPVLDKTEVMLFQASRAQIVGEKIKPHLANGGVVLEDRHGDSSIVYQGYAKGVGAFKIDQFNKFSTDGLKPDLTILLDITAENGIMRRKKGSLFGEEWNRLDALALAFHEKVVYGYKILHDYDQENRWVMVDANRSIDEVRVDVERVVVNRLMSSGHVESYASSSERR